jgi:hypothetical protein
MDVRESQRQSGLFLEQTRPQSASARWALGGNRMRVGRDPAADICIDDKRASWYHADLIRQGLAWLIVDAGSTNGTFVNGRRVHEATVVRPYDRIRVGDTELVVRHLVRDPGPLTAQGPLAGQAESPGALSARAWNRATKVILGAGALATAIAAVLALAVRFLPSPEHENVARFLTVQPLSQLPLNQYQRRTAAFGTQSDGRLGNGARLIAAVAGQSSPSAQADPSDEPTPSPTAGTPPPTASPQPSPTVSPGGTPAPTASPGGTASPATTSPTPTGSPAGLRAGQILSPPPPGISPKGEHRIGTDLVRVVAGEDPTLDLTHHCPECADRLLHLGALDPAGDNRPLQQAGATIASVLQDSQSVPASPGTGSQGTGGSGKRVPLGELVSVNMELAGLQGQPVFLSWSIFQESGQNRLFGRWLSNFVAYRLEATTEDDTGTLEMWIPLPKPPGPYFIRVSLSTDGASLTSMDSGPFA